jgi:hypothetical protein
MLGDGNECRPRICHKVGESEKQQLLGKATAPRSMHCIEEMRGLCSIEEMRGLTQVGLTFESKVVRSSAASLWTQYKSWS